ncbi:hypothetical protein JCM4814A_27860 [Streptomyces phaeofaciens JCM 4814]|uniref:Phosphatidylserine/phosphatidylglycerophosphate/ cardiolipin synthase family protein n=1 Tax=Streptomyces phaeofaciens TaxID=68254 RepID=A0A918LQL4_9ACTN|nr:hypothetical protein GCM10010226_13200 [Streptomyces phaeofaciens]
MRIAPVVLKTLITVAVTTVAYVITDLIDLSRDGLWKLGMSVAIGCSALIVQYLVDVERRLTSTEAGERERARGLQDHLTRLSEDAGLLTELDRAGMSTSGARRLLTSASQVGLQGPEIMKAFVRAELERLASVVTGLTAMTAHWPRDNDEWLIGLTECARSTIDVTSSSVGLPSWDTDRARKSLDAQIAAMRDPGVRIRRLFLISAAEESDLDFMDRFTALCRGQQELGITVRFLVLSPQRHVRAVAARDLVIFDGELYLEFEPDRQQGDVETRLDADILRVDQQVRRFNELWEAAAEPGPRPGSATRSPAE